MRALDPLTPALAVASCVAVLALAGSTTTIPTAAQTAATSARSIVAAPAAPVRMVKNALHGIPLEDPYRWMEEPGSTEFAEWMKAQGRYARVRLEGIPGRADMVRRVSALMLTTANVRRVRRAGGSLFFLRMESGAMLARLVVRTADGGERTLFDPAAAQAGKGPHLAIDSFQPSPDGRLVAITVSQGGGEIGRVRVIETATAQMRPDTIERVFGPLQVSWLPDASGFFYTQMDPKGFQDPTVDKLLGMRARFHRLGSSPEQDAILLGPGVNPRMPIDPIEVPVIEAPPASDWVLALAFADSSKHRVCVVPRAELQGAAAPWRCVAGYEDQVRDAAIHGSNLYLLSARDAPNRRVVRLRLTESDSTTREVVIPESQTSVLTGIAAARDALYVQELERASRLWRLPHGGALQEIRLPIPQAMVTQPAPGGRASLVTSPEDDGVLLAAQSWVQGAVWYTYDPRTNDVSALSFGTTARTGLPPIEVESVEIKSFDGVSVPLTILRRRDSARDGSSPAVLNGYAGYGQPLRPTFGPGHAVWLEHGGIIAWCHARGGGEKGTDWHLAGKGPNKRNGVRDFIACAEYLDSKGYSRSSRIAASGASMGGVLVGGAIAERPDAFGAAILNVAILNTVRVVEGINGASQIPELGDPQTPEGYRSLAMMDPYHHVRTGVKYPAVMLTIGLNDPRVAPWHSGKFAARLQAATASGRPVLLRIEEEAGHGRSTRDRNAERLADVFTFLLWQLGHPKFQPRT